MAITYPVSLPSLGIMQITMIAVNVTAISTSPFTAQQQAYRHQGMYWKADITLPKMLRSGDAEEWISALVSLCGQYGTLLLGDPVGKTPRGIMSGTPVVNGNSQTGLELDIRGLTPLASGVLKVGDYIQIGTGSSSRLHKVLKDVDADASGNATLDIWPQLRTSPADGGAVIYENCKGVFRLQKNESPFTYVSPELASISFSVIEAL